MKTCSEIRGNLKGRGTLNRQTNRGGNTPYPLGRFEWIKFCLTAERLKNFFQILEKRHNTLDQFILLILQMSTTDNKDITSSRYCKSR